MSTRGCSKRTPAAGCYSSPSGSTRGSTCSPTPSGHGSPRPPRPPPWRAARSSSLCTATPTRLSCATCAFASPRRSPRRASTTPRTRGRLLPRSRTSPPLATSTRTAASNWARDSGQVESDDKSMTNRRCNWRRVSHLSSLTAASVWFTTKTDCPKRCPEGRSVGDARSTYNQFAPPIHGK